MQKNCPHCMRLLDENEFNWKFKYTKRASYCKDCSRVYIREHYEKNRKYYIEKAMARNKATRTKEFEYLLAFLTEHPCIDCGQSDIRVLEFDHRDRKDKDDAVSQLMSRGIPFARIVKEIAKCDVRCANCHRIKTINETGTWRSHFAPVG